jgi:hypothetical protein
MPTNSCSWFCKRIVHGMHYRIKRSVCMHNGIKNAKKKLTCEDLPLPCVFESDSLSWFDKSRCGAFSWLKSRHSSTTLSFTFQSQTKHARRAFWTLSLNWQVYVRHVRSHAPSHFQLFFWTVNVPTRIHISWIIFQHYKVN